MALAVRPPVPPMLARLVRELPVGAYLYEPKWDGFRCLAFVDGGEVDLRSRHDRPLARYFPEVVAALRAATPGSVALDGELILVNDAATGPPDFSALMSRLHPAATRVERLARETPAAYVAFDLLALDGEDLRERPLRERRGRLETLLADPPPGLHLTPATRDPATAARWFEAFRGGGIDGVVAKPEDGAYEPGRRAMVKVKHERTADCVLAGLRLIPDTLLVSSLLLGLYATNGELRHVGVVTQLPKQLRAELLRDLAPIVIPLEQHPWRHGFTIGRSPLGRLPGSAARWTPDMEHDWVSLRPDRVVEVGFDQVDVDRFRHPARFRRWRPDRTATSCEREQIEVHAPDLAAVLRSPIAA